MVNTNSQQEFRATLKEFSMQKREELGDYAYVSGYYESMVANMFQFLSSSDQKIFVLSMEKALDKTTV